MLAKELIIKFISYSLGLSILLSLFGCDAGEETVADYSNCRYEKPEAIFYNGLPQISKHRFISRGRGSEETFILSGSISVSIFQYGCDYRTQEFVFELEGRAPCDGPESCTLQIARLLQSLSRLGPEYHVFRAWGQAIKDTAPQITFGKNTQLAEGFWVKIDQEQSFGSTTLSMTLSEKP